MPTEIVIIKLGALGDVVRTLPLLNAIKKKYPESKLTWITKKNAIPLFKGINDVDNLCSIEDLETNTDLKSTIKNKKFDVLFNFDIESKATNLARQINSKQKYGFKANQGEEYCSTYNLGAEYYLNTIFDDELKKNNKKTYQEMMFDVAELDRHLNKIYPLVLSKEEQEYAQDFLEKNNLKNKKIIGIHIGASSRWPSKKWHKDNVKDFIKKSQELGYSIILFGGTNEVKEQDLITKELKDIGINVIQNNPNNTIREFISLVNICDWVVCGDSFCLHVALALKKRVVGLFFCTSPHEIEGYNLLSKKISPKLNEFFPEKMDQYNEDLVKSISSNEVLEEIIRFFN